MYCLLVWAVECSQSEHTHKLEEKEVHKGLVVGYHQHAGEEEDEDNDGLKSPVCFLQLCLIHQSETISYEQPPSVPGLQE